MVRKNFFAIISIQFCLFLSQDVFGEDVYQRYELFADTCGHDKEVLKRAGRLTSIEVSRGIETLLINERLQSLAVLSLMEQCLSVVASALAMKPILVVTRPEVKASENMANDIDATISSQTKLEAKLSKLDVGYWKSGDHIESGYSKLFSDYPSLATDLSNQALSFRLHYEHRSFSVDREDHCVVVMDSSSLMAYLDKMTIGRRIREMSDLHAWIVKSGEAHEFWHEVAHCQSMSNSSSKADFQTRSMISIGRLTESACGGMKSSPTDIEVNGGSMLSHLWHEYLADEYALNVIQTRLGEYRTCSSLDDMEELFRIRLHLSMRNPSPQYMTWLVPLLEGYPQEGQMIALTEAWEALKRVTVELRLVDSISMIKKIKKGRLWVSPVKSIQENRILKWQAWLKRMMNESKANPLKYSIKDMIK